MELLRRPHRWAGFGAGTALVLLVVATLGPFRESLPAAIPAVVLVLPVDDGTTRIVTAPGVGYRLLAPGD